MSYSRKKIKQTPSDRKDAYPASLGRITEPPIQISNGKGVLPNELSRLSIDYQLTVRFRISEIQRREVSLLLAVLTYQVSEFGATFSDYLGIEHCVSYLIGNKASAWEIKDPKERITVLSSLTILSQLRGRSLYLEDRQVLDPGIREELQSQLLISKRQWGSLKQHYNASRYLELRAVPLDVYYERNENTQRYDSYTKGYKDGGSAAPRKKTRYSSELDGEESEKEIVFPLLDFRQYQTVLFYDLKRKPLKR